MFIILMTFRKCLLIKFRRLFNISAHPKSFIRKTAFAAAITHFKPVFTGSLLDFSKESFTMVASDTHRLAIIKNDQIKLKKDSKYIIL